MRRPLNTALVASVTIFALATAPLSRAEAAPASSESDDAPKLFRRGLAAFETSDYETAIRLWTDAYASLEASAENRAIRNDLVYNISTAQVEWYGLDGDVTHLKQARRQIQRYLDESKEMGVETGEDVTRANERIVEIDGLIAKAEEGKPTPAPGPAPEGPADPETKPADKPELKDPVSTSKPGRALIITGGVLAGVGLGGLGAMTAGMVMGSKAEGDFEDDPGGRFDAEKRGKDANVIAIVGGAVGGALLITGVALLVVGVLKGKGKGNGKMSRISPYALGMQARF